MGKFDALIGINLLREGLDIPEVGLVAILDGDKEGFLRDTRSLIQTIGRASRNVNGRAIIYADHRTDSIENAIKETYRRREKQITYNEEHGITPTTIQKRVQESLAEAKEEIEPKAKLDQILKDSIQQAEAETDIIKLLESAMLEASQKLEFEKAAYFRDKIKAIKEGKADPNQLFAGEDGSEKVPQVREEDSTSTMDTIPKSYDDIHLLGTTKRRKELPDYRPTIAHKKTTRCHTTWSRDPRKVEE